MQILITGVAGFIGHFLSKKLAEKKLYIYGIDSVNDYYDVELKKSRLRDCGINDFEYGKEYTSGLYSNYKFLQIDICDKVELEKLFAQNHFDCVINLAAQAGVRHSLTDPGVYVQNNVVGFMNLLEVCQKHACEKFIYASSSSVYGNSTEVPFKETARTDQPVSIYAATKKSNELMAYTFSSLYRLPTIGLRFFTVYGPSGRPDMAPMLFANAIHKNETIKIFNNGNLSRDFTYIDDIVEGISRIVTTPGIVREENPGIPAVVYNIGHGSPVKLLDFIRILEENFEKTAHKEFVGMQPGDVYRTWADTTRLEQDYNYHAQTPLEYGIRQFAQWYKTYHQNK